MTVALVTNQTITKNNFMNKVFKNEDNSSIFSFKNFSDYYHSIKNFKLYLNNNNNNNKKKCDKKRQTIKLLKFEEAPQYLKHNQFIKNGYRDTMDTKLCIESIFWWTNESINIWSHIFGFLLFIGLAINDLFVLKVDASVSDKIIVASVLICFQFCMILSALYHTFSCKSQEYCDFFLSFDLFGIALSLLAIYTSGIYYAFWCEFEIKIFYLLTITIIFILVMILQLPYFNVHPNIKMGAFILWAAYGILPTFHWIITMGGLDNPVVQLLLPRVFGMYGISGLAFFIYITKIPERYYSGGFDFLGHSHQWWHFFVVIALYYWHNTGMIYVGYRLNHACLS